MLSFAPTEEQEEIRNLAHSIALDHLRPQAREAERNGDISPALAQTLIQTGLTTPFSEAYGGSGEIEALTYVLIAEELGFGDGGQAMNIVSSLMAPVAVSLAGNTEQREQYLPPFGYHGMSERGSFAFAEHGREYTLDDIKAVARRDGQDYLLSGTKRAVIHGTRASLRVLLARLEEDESDSRIRAFILPASGEGLEIGQERDKLGLRAASSVSYSLKDVRVGGAMLLGSEEGATRAAALYLLLRAAIACGTARAALEYASKYAEERIAFGRPIVSYQGIAFILAEMAMKLDAARLLLWKAAAGWDRQVSLETVVRDVEAAHLQALKIAKAATIDAVQVMGGAGFMQDHPVEMWMRNAAAME